jgi:hypothetical protein
LSYRLVGEQQELAGGAEELLAGRGWRHRLEAADKHAAHGAL